MKIIFSILVLALAISGCSSIANLERQRRKVDPTKCISTIVKYGKDAKDGKGFFIGSIQLMQNMFRDMATSSSGEVRNKFRKDIARIFKGFKDSLNINDGLLKLILSLEGTGTSIADAEKKSKGIDFATPITIKKVQGTNPCSALYGIIDDLVTKMQLHQQKDKLIVDILDKSLAVIKAGLSVTSDVAEDTGIGIAATVGIKAAQAALDQVDSSWFKSKLNSIMRVTRTAFWNAVATVVNPLDDKFKITVKGKVENKCLIEKVTTIVNDLKWAFKSLITEADRESFRDACRAVKEEKTFRISTGQTVWHKAMELFTTAIADSPWGKASAGAIGGLGDAVSNAAKSGDDSEDNS